MELIDRVEMDNGIFNVHTLYYEYKEIVKSIIYIEKNKRCIKLKTISESLDSKDAKMTLSAMHKTMLEKLFNILRTNPKEFEIQIKLEEERNNNPIKLDIKINPKEENNSNQTELDWEEFCQQTLPQCASFSFFINESRINAYGEDEINEEISNQVITIYENFKQNKEKINTLIGSCNSIVVLNDSGYSFFYFLFEQNLLVVVAKDKRLGICQKELKPFCDKVIKKFL